MVKLVNHALQHFNSLDRDIKHVRIDSGGENEAIKLLCKIDGASLELNPPCMPKFNGKIE